MRYGFSKTLRLAGAPTAAGRTALCGGTAAPVTAVPSVLRVEGNQPIT